MSNELTNLMEQDQEHLIEKTDIESLALQCQRLQDIEQQIQNSEEHTKNLKTMYDQISSEIIPNMLAEQGLQSLKLADGSSVEVKRKYSCTLPKDEDKKRQAYEWLRSNGLGDLIKNEVAVTFGVGEDNKAKQLLNLAAEQGYEPQQKEKVEPMTLKGFISGAYRGRPRYAFRVLSFVYEG
jgi:hypothetical protein